MRATVKQQVTKKSKKGIYSVFVLVNFFNSIKKLAGFNFITDSMTLRSVCKFCKTKNEKFKDEVYQYLVDEPGNFEILFRDKSLQDPSLLFSPEYNETFQEYSNIVLHYLCCLDTVVPFLEGEGVEETTFLINVDVSDKSKTKILGSFYKDGVDEDIDHQLN